MMFESNKECEHCGCVIHFNERIKKWVTTKEHWKCWPSKEFPVRAHRPKQIDQEAANA